MSRSSTVSPEIERGLSLRQPWAWLVVNGLKDLENRRWNTRFRGTFLIHAAQGMTRAEYDRAVTFTRAVDPEIVIPAFDDLPRGGIVGSARLVDVHLPCTPSPLTQEEMFEPVTCKHPWHMRGQYGFVLEAVRQLPFKKLKGSLNFFRLPTAHGKNAVIRRTVA